MLEGQVAVLGSEYLDAKKLKRLKALRRSKLYREDQKSYILSNKILPLLLTEIPSLAAVAGSKLLQLLLKKETIKFCHKMLREYHFNGNFKNVDDLKQALAYTSSIFQLSRRKRDSISHL